MGSEVELSNPLSQDGLPVELVQGTFCGTIDIADADIYGLTLDSDFFMVVKGHIWEFAGKINKSNGNSNRKVKLEVQEAHCLTDLGQRTKLLFDLGFEDAGPLYDTTVTLHAVGEEPLYVSEETGEIYE